MSINFAITGNFASGKSFIMNVIKNMGYKVFSCDEYVKELYKDIDFQQKVIFLIEGFDFFDKKQLAVIIFNDNAKREKLEELIFPLVLNGIKKFKQKNMQAKYLFFEVPLLFEAGYDQYFDYSISIFCSESTRYKRAKQRENFDEQIYNKINNIHLPVKEKQKLANYTINSDDSPEEIRKNIEKVLCDIVN